MPADGHGLGHRLSTTPFAFRQQLREVLPTVPITVEKRLNVPLQYRTHYDQGHEGACVGFGFSWMMSILNRKKYEAHWLYEEAQKVDPWADTPPEEGTSSEAGAKVLIDEGHRRIWGGQTWLPHLKDGISAVRWANPSSPVDELRICIANGIPFGMGINWHYAFDAPEWDRDSGWWIGKDPNILGGVRGGHFICGYGASDRYQAFYLVNSWGNDFPLVKIPYKVIEKLGQEGGDFAVITDR